MRGHKYSDDVYAEIVNLLSQGLSQSEVGRRLGIAQTTISGFIAKQKKKAPEIENWTSAWIKKPEGTYYIKKDIEENFSDIREKTIQQMDEHSPVYKAVNRLALPDGHLLIVDLADIHIGKFAAKEETGEDYNQQIAMMLVKDAVEGLIQKTKGFNIDQILLVIGNDILHTDGSKTATTKGTPQDTDGFWWQNFNIARSVIVDAIERLVTIAPVHAIHVPSNHDYANGYFLADTLKSWFRLSVDVTIDSGIAPRKYYQYHNNMIGVVHDGGKINELPLMMANEDKKMWGATEKRYFYIHHVHHKQQFKFQSGKDFTGVTVEAMRSPSAADSWHNTAGYKGAKRAIEAFIHNKEDGQIARITHNIN